MGKQVSYDIEHTAYEGTASISPELDRELLVDIDDALEPDTTPLEQIKRTQQWERAKRVNDGVFTGGLVSMYGGSLADIGGIGQAAFLAGGVTSSATAAAHPWLGMMEQRRSQDIGRYRLIDENTALSLLEDQEAVRAPRDGLPYDVMEGSGAAYDIREILTEHSKTEYVLRLDENDEDTLADTDYRFALHVYNKEGVDGFGKPWSRHADEYTLTGYTDDESLEEAGTPLVEKRGALERFIGVQLPAFDPPYRSLLYRSGEDL